MKEHSLHYHRHPVPGKIGITPIKPCATQGELSLAYTPGVAWPCLEIHENTDDSYEYTGRGNLVAVISDGTAVLGLGDIGPEAAKPVMEGKALLFKRFANIDSFDIELRETDPERLIDIIAAMEPTFGGINLEDISSPRCFTIEQELKKRLSIPVFHDDQHGTAVIAGAAVLNGLEIAGKSMASVKVAMSGAGAAGVAIAKHLISLGLNPEQIFCTDKDGVLYEGRPEKVSPYHSFLFKKTVARTLADIMCDADIFIGVSVKNLVDAKMLQTMAKNPIVFAMANPDPEVPFAVIQAVRPDAIAGTGRSDFPNQVNNVLGFPAIFRGALDIRARAITDGMKIAASKALAALAKREVPQEVLATYGLQSLSFGSDYVIPKPFDRRVVIEVATAVAAAGAADGVGRITVDIDRYKAQLSKQFLGE